MTKAGNLNSINQLQTLEGQEINAGTSFVNNPVENIVRPETQPEQVPTFKGIGKAFGVFLDDNTVLSTTKYIQDNGFNIIPQKLDPNYDPFSDIPPEKLDFVENYKYANNPQEVSTITNRINQQLENKRILNEEVGTGAALIGGLFAGVTDPINFIPIGGELYKSFKIGNVARGALRTGTAGLISATAAEGILQAEQETRSAEESAMNIASATLLSGVLGGAGSALSKEKFHETAGKLNKDITIDKADLEIDPQTQELRSVGAKQVVAYDSLYQDYLKENLPTGKQPMTLREFQNKQESLVGGVGGSAGVIAKSLSKINPLLRTFNSQSVEAKSLLQDLATHNMIVGKNEAGIASQQSVETSVKQWRAGLGEALPVNNTAFKEYKIRAAQEGMQSPIKNIADWNVEVSKAMRRGDVSNIPEVAKAAKEWRSKVFDPLKNAAIETKLLPQDVKPETAVSYLSRLWNKKAIIAKESDLREIISNKLRDVELPKVKDSFKYREENFIREIGDLKARQAELQSFIDPSQADLIQKAKGNLTGLSDDQLFDILNKYKEAAKDLREIKPKSLLQFIRENGGIHDNAGELSSRGINNKSMVGLVKSSPLFTKTDLKGKHTTKIDFDSVALRAWEAGYFPELHERPTINNLLDAIEEDFNGKKIYSENDLENVRIRELAKEFIDNLNENGIDIAKIKEAKNFKELKLSERTKVDSVTQTVNPIDLITTKTSTKTTSRSIPDLIVGTEIKLLESKIKRLDEKLKLKQNQFGDIFDGAVGERQYIDEITNNILTNLKGESRFDAVSNYDFKITARGPLKERTLSFIRDEEVEQFLENDVQAIADRYTRIMGTDVELSRKFDGDVNLEGRLRKVKEEYETLAEQAKSEEQRLKIQKEKVSVLRDLTALRDIQRGIYATPENPDSLILRSFRVGRQLNYATKLGGVVLSSLNDTVQTVGVHGFGRFSQGLGHVISNMKGVRLNVREAKKAGNILENVLHGRLATLAELTDPLSNGHSRFERFTANVARLGTKLNGIALWNDTMKGFASVLTQQRLIKESQKLLDGKISKKNRTYLAFLGIDDSGARMIQDQLKKFSSKEKNLWVANTENWTNQEAVRLYRNALNQDVDRTIVTKTAGDVPLFMNTELGKTIGQFKSFTFASTQQVLIARLQQGDAAALNGFISAVSLGMMSYYIKTIAAGKDPSDKPEKWVTEGIDRSGVLGIIMEINNVTEKVTRGGIGINALTGGEMMSRYASRGIVDTLAGPTAGQIKDLTTISAAISSGDIKESDVKAFRRMLPYQNVFYLQKLFDEFEQSAKKNLVQ